jgi:hypothetical protein
LPGTIQQTLFGRLKARAQASLQQFRGKPGTKPGGGGAYLQSENVRQFFAGLPFSIVFAYKNPCQRLRFRLQKAHRALSLSIAN